MNGDRYREITLSENFPSIAICTVGELFGGVERHVLGLIKGLASRGINPLLVLFHANELAAQARGLGIEPIILPTSNLSLLTTVRRIAQVLKQRNITVVHAHGYKATVFCALARAWYRFGMVKTEHGLPEPMARNPILAWRNLLYHVADSIALRATGATVCYVTDDLRRSYQQKHSGLPAMVIPNGVENMDRRQFPRPPELRKEWFNVLVVGRLDTVKGHRFAIEAMAADGIALDVRLHFVGLGPLHSELQSLAKSLGVARRLNLLGFRRNIYDYIAHCNALLMPSLHEGLPYTLLEAMALGTPMIASRIGGLAEVLQDGATALLMPPRDAASLALAIVRLHNDQGLCSQLGKEAQCLQRAKYTLDVMTQNYLGVYQTFARRIQKI